jgi:UDP-glucose 4-epimerase
MKILLTGAGGFIGGKVREHLRSKHEVLAADVTGKGTEIRNLDVSDKLAVEEFFSSNPDVEMVVHLAAKSQLKGRKGDLPEYMRINTDGTRNVVEASRRFFTSMTCFMFASSVSVYGEERWGEITEDINPRPRSPYAISKFEAEKIVSDTLPDAARIFRFSPVFAAGNSINLERRISFRGSTFLVGGGGVSMTLLDIRNILHLLDLLVLGQIPPGTYNVADEKAYTYRSIIHALGKDASKAIRIPRSAVVIVRLLGKIIRNTSIIETASKLLYNHNYPAYSLRQHADLPFAIGGSIC